MAEPQRATPFPSAAEAWRWALLALARRAGTEPPRQPSSSTVVRPCDPDDVVTVFRDLIERRIITRDHARVLRRFAWVQPTLQADNEMWDEAMTAAEPALRAKGIVQ